MSIQNSVYSSIGEYIPFRHSAVSGIPAICISKAHGNTNTILRPTVRTRISDTRILSRCLRPRNSMPTNGAIYSKKPVLNMSYLLRSITTVSKCTKAKFPSGMLTTWAHTGMLSESCPNPHRITV